MGEGAKFLKRQSVVGTVYLQKEMMILFLYPLYE